MASAATAVLAAHSGAVKVSRGELVHVVTPERTRSHTTIPHSELLDLIESNLNARNLQIEKEEYAIQSDGGMKLFGIMTLKHQIQDDFRFAMGIRTSNDKTLPVQVIAGTRVFVCDNMAFSGDVTVLVKKHTAHLDIRKEVEGGVCKAIAKFDKLASGISEMKSQEISEDRAKAMILNAALKGVMPLRMLPDVAKNYMEPPHDEFKPRTMWSLHNAFTEAFKLLRPNVAMQSGIELGQMFGI